MKPLSAADFRIGTARDGVNEGGVSAAEPARKAATVL
jgi:hypothetical protein